MNESPIYNSVTVCPKQTHMGVYMYIASVLAHLHITYLGHLQQDV